MGSAGTNYDSGDVLTPARLNQKSITADTGANCNADTKYAGMIFMPSSSDGSLTADIPAYIKSDATTLEDFVTRTSTQTLTNKTLTSPTISSATLSNPTISNPKMQFLTRIPIYYPPVLTMYNASNAGTIEIQRGGYIELTTTNSIGDDGYISVADTSTIAGFVRGDRAFEATFAATIAQTADTEFEIGFSNDSNPTALMTSSDVHMSILYDKSTSANWIQRNANAGGGGNQTSTTSSTAVTTGIHYFTILNTESAIAFYVDGTILGTAHTTNLPTTTTMGFFCHVQTEATAAKTAYYIGGSILTDNQ